jgi:TRAP-type C4-dicarboxylate transport system permease small subunit
VDALAKSGSPGHPLSRAIGILTGTAEVIGGIAIIGLMLLVVVDVSLRYLAGSPLRGTIDYVSYLLMPAMVTLGFAVAERNGEHIGNPTLLNRLARPERRNVVVLSGALVIAFLAFQIWAAWGAALESLASEEFSPGGLGLPLWPARFLIPLGLALFAVEFIRRLVSNSALRAIESGELEDLGIKEWD